MPWSEASVEELRRITARQKKVDQSRSNHADVPCALFDLQTRPSSIIIITSISDGARPSERIPTAIPLLLVLHESQSETIAVADPFFYLSESQVQQDPGQIVDDAITQGRSQYYCCCIC